MTFGFSKRSFDSNNCWWSIVKSCKNFVIFFACLHNSLHSLFPDNFLNKICVLCASINGRNKVLAFSFCLLLYLATNNPSKQSLEEMWAIAVLNDSKIRYVNEALMLTPPFKQVNRAVELAGGWIFFYNFIKWRGGNKMTYQENHNNPKRSRRVDDPIRWF